MLPDIRPDYFSVDQLPYPEGNPAPGETFDFRVSIELLTSDASYPVGSFAGVFLSTDRTYSTDDFLIGSYEIPTIVPSFPYYDLVDTFMIPEDFSHGTYYLIFATDYSGIVDEVNEANNWTFGVQIDIVGPPPPPPPEPEIGNYEVSLHSAMLLASASYHVDSSRESASSNVQSDTGDASFSQLFHNNSIPLELLNNDDLSIDGTSRSSFKNGLYINKNAAALVARDDDTLFLSFRGTNDLGFLVENLAENYVQARTKTLVSLLGNGSLPDRFQTPDVSDWLDLEGHFDLFTPLFSSLAEYVRSEGIKEIEVVGHSLGGSIVEQFVSNFGDIYANAGIKVSGHAFASPGFDNLTFNDTVDERVTRVTHEGDIVGHANLGTSQFGLDVTIYGSDGRLRDWGHRQADYLDTTQAITEIEQVLIGATVDAYFIGEDGRDHWFKLASTTDSVVIYGREGSDRFDISEHSSTASADTFIFAVGDGHDRVVGFDLDTTSGVTDQLVLVGLDLANASLRGSRVIFESGEQIQFAGASRTDILEYLVSDNVAQFDEFEFAIT